MEAGRCKVSWKKTAVMGQKVTINDSIMVKGKNISKKKNRFLTK